MSARAEIRAAVIGQLVAVMKDAEAQGCNAMLSAQETYPDVPYLVVLEAWLQVDADKTDAWWRSIEKTIDGEIVRRALTDGGAA